MVELKQRLRDVLTYKKNAGAVQAKIQVLTEMADQVQSLKINGENGGRDDVQQWLAEAKKISVKANGILEGSISVFGKKCLCTSCWDLTSSWATGDLLRCIDRILKDLEGMDLSSLVFEPPYSKHLQLIEFEPPYSKHLQSRENMLEEILEALMDIHINMIGIYGMFGVGKTVLAKELTRHDQCNQLFDAILMVQVPESLDIKLIQTQIADKIGLLLSETDDEETRARILCNKLDEKFMESVHQSKILVILDGINHVIDLRKIGISHEWEGKSRCKVIVISRNVDVCNEMGADKNFLLECLNLEETKILFRERLGDKIESIDVNPESERYLYVENVMLMKCGGLPRMINSLACALKSVSWSNWEILADQMERHTLLEIEEVKEVPCAVLELCNNFIQNDEKHKLFLLCCLLIQQGDDDVHLERLMRYGTGFGLFEVGSSDFIVGQINSWVHELKSLSLLMERKRPQHVKIHNLIQDVIISALSQGIDSLPIMVEACIGLETRESFENCVAMWMRPDSNLKCLNGLEFPKLEAFLLKRTTREPPLSLPDEFFQGMKNLKILDTSGITYLPSSIGDLKNLVTLHLEDCYISGEVIFAICNLERLEVLSLRGSTFETLPDEIENLTNLRVLDLTGCYGLDTFPVDGVAKLNQLREVYLLLSRKQPKWSTRDMMKLEPLPLEVFEIIYNTNQLSPGCFNFPNLRRFRILLYGDGGGGCGDKSLLEDDGDFTCYSRALLINLKYGGLQLLEQSGLKDLLPRAEYLHIKEVDAFIQSIIDVNINKFSQLKELYIDQCNTMECLVDERNVSMIQQAEMFPELQLLTLKRLPNLATIFRGQQPCYGFFPKLREVRFDGLSQLQHVLPLQLGVQLRVIQVSDCRCLVHIFSTSMIDEIHDEKIAELSSMEKLELKGLPKMKSILEAHFNEKIKLPSLKELHLERLDQIQEIWDFLGSEESGGKSPCFSNLKQITISDCKNLESMFTPGIVNSLLQLEKLQIDRCENMKEVITSSEFKAEDDTNPTTTINFPKLQMLHLEGLSSLECFYGGQLELKFSKLRRLHLFKLENLKAFSLPNTQSLQTQGMTTTLFHGVIDFGSLEHLWVAGLEIELLQRDSETTIFPNLSGLNLEGLQNLKALPNINPRTLRSLNLDAIEFSKVLSSSQPVAHKYVISLIMSWELEELILSRLDDSFWKELLVYSENQIDDGQQSNVKLFSSLRKLELFFMLCQPERIPWNRLKNLRFLTIVGLKEAGTSLISTTLLVGGNVLPLLEDIKIEACDDLEAIITGEAEEDSQYVKYGITLFPCLRSIYFGQLPSLKSFSMGTYEAHFPSLETVEIRDCGGMQSFSMGERIRTPRLKLLKVDLKIIAADRFININGLFQSSKIFGLSYCKNLESREKLLQDILEATMNTYINMIGIYGMIGVGKTILVTEMERRAHSNKLFHVVVMVQVSDPLDIMHIQIQIANKIGLQISENVDEGTRARLLKNTLAEKVMEESGQKQPERATQQRKILFIFDGIQHAISLEKVGIPCGRKFQSRCMVVLVSRNVDVCKRMGTQENFLVECLDSEESTILFQETLGDKIRSIDITIELSERYQCIEKAIFKCGGLPSIITSLAYALWCRSHSDRESIAEHMGKHTLLEAGEIINKFPHTKLATHSSDRIKLKWLSDEHTRVNLKHQAHAILELCNNFLRKGDEHKRFLLCCLIQQDTNLISLEKIMRYGIGFGLFDDSLANVVDQINSWVDKLKHQSLLMESKETQHVKMHNIVRDVAISALSHGDCSLLPPKEEGDYSLPVMLEACTGLETRSESFENCVVISIKRGTNIDCLNGLELPQLEAFLLQHDDVFGRSSSLLADNFFQGMPNLKILDISRISGNFAPSIRNLKNLITLHLEDCYIISGEVISLICNLEKLQVLSLRGSTFGTLPDEIGNLTNLRVLDLTGCYGLTRFPIDGVVKLGQLRELYLLVGGNRLEWSTDDIEKFGAMDLEGFEIKINADQVSIGSINFPNLRRFRILNSTNSSIYCDGSDLTSYSRALSIKRESGSFELSSLKDLIGKAEYLRVEEVSDVEYLVDATYLPISQQREMFQELQVLTLKRLPNLKSMCRLQPFKGLESMQSERLQSQDRTFK